jgi:hypothetical protein
MIEGHDARYHSKGLADRDPLSCGGTTHVLDGILSRAMPIAAVEDGVVPRKCKPAKNFDVPYGSGFGHDMFSAPIARSC